MSYVIGSLLHWLQAYQPPSLPRFSSQPLEVCLWWANTGPRLSRNLRSASAIWGLYRRHWWILRPAAPTRCKAVGKWLNQVWYKSDLHDIQILNLNSSRLRFFTLINVGDWKKQKNSDHCTRHICWMCSEGIDWAIRSTTDNGSFGFWCVRTFSLARIKLYLLSQHTSLMPC